MACEIDFNPVTLSWRSTVDNLGENVAGPDRFAALRVKREPEHLFSALQVVIKSLLKVGMVGRRAGERVYGLTNFPDSTSCSNANDLMCYSEADV